MNQKWMIVLLAGVILFGCLFVGCGGGAFIFFNPGAVGINNARCARQHDFYISNIRDQPKRIVPCPVCGGTDDCEAYDIRFQRGR